MRYIELSHISRALGHRIVGGRLRSASIASVDRVDDPFLPKTGMHHLICPIKILEGCPKRILDDVAAELPLQHFVNALVETELVSRRAVIIAGGGKADIGEQALGHPNVPFAEGADMLKESFQVSYDVFACSLLQHPIEKLEIADDREPAALAPGPDAEGNSTCPSDWKKLASIKADVSA